MEQRGASLRGEGEAGLSHDATRPADPALQGRRHRVQRAEARHHREKGIAEQPDSEVLFQLLEEPASRPTSCAGSPIATCWSRLRDHQGRARRAQHDRRQPGEAPRPPEGRGAPEPILEHYLQGRRARRPDDQRLAHPLPDWRRRRAGDDVRRLRCGCTPLRVYPGRARHRACRRSSSSSAGTRAGCCWPTMAGHVPVLGEGHRRELTRTGSAATLGAPRAAYHEQRGASAALRPDGGAAGARLRHPDGGTRSRGQGGRAVAARLASTEVGEVRIGKYVELACARGTRPGGPGASRRCARLLANGVIEDFRSRSSRSGVGAQGVVTFPGSNDDATRSGRGARAGRRGGSALAQGPATCGASTRHPAGRLLVRRLPALRRDRSLLADHGRGRTARRARRPRARHLQRVPDPREAGLLPGALGAEPRAAASCATWSPTRRATDTPFTYGCRAGEVLTLPIKHGEGCWVVQISGPERRWN